jgi:hypothetical protein
MPILRGRGVQENTAERTKCTLYLKFRGDNVADPDAIEIRRNRYTPHTAGK